MKATFLGPKVFVACGETFSVEAYYLLYPLGIVFNLAFLIEIYFLWKKNPPTIRPADSSD